MIYLLLIKTFYRKGVLTIMKMKNTLKILTLVFTICLSSTLMFSLEASAKTVTSSHRWKKIEEPGGYGPTQGMCRDSSGNIYFAKIMKNGESKVKIYKISASNKTQKHLITKSSDVFGHANDMTYCPEDGLIYIATGGGDQKAKHDIVAIDKKGNVKKEYDYNKMGTPTGIAYDSKTKMFYIKSGKNIHVAKLQNGKFSKQRSFSLEEGSYSDTGDKGKYSRQGLAVYNGKIYASYWYKNTKTKSAILKFNSSGKKLSAITFKSNSVTKLFEIEGLDFNSSGDLFFITNGGTSTSSSYDEVYKISNYAK